MARTARKKRGDPKKQSSIVREIVAVVMLALALMLAISLRREGVGMGIFGKTMRHVFLLVVGRHGSLLLVIGLFACGLRLLLGRRLSTDRWELPSALLLFFTALAGLQLRDGLLPLPAWANETASGLLGNLLVWALASVFGTTGTWLVLACSTLVGLLGLTRVSLVGLLQRFWTRLVALFALPGEQPDRRKRPAGRGDPASLPAENLVISDYYTDTAARQPAPVEAPPAAAEAFDPEPAPPPIVETRDWQVEQLSLRDSLDPAVAGDAEVYQLPSLNLLNRPFRSRNPKQNRDIYENSRTLETTLGNFGIQARVIQATKGPAVTRYEIQTAPGTKVSRVTSLADDIALSLACSEVRIEAPIPGKAAIGIEVPNKSVTLVLLREVLESKEFRDAGSVLTVALGKDIAGKAIVANLADMPHLLIAGATGSGKSVCINTMIASILYKGKPQEVKFLMIDPKVVELSSYNGIPHLLAPVVNHPKKAAAALKWATGEMERRYGVFAKSGVRDITRYNEWAESAGKETLPYIVIIIDELADLMMVARADVEDAICRLAQMARAAGMHLVIGTQRPSTDVITGLIKANIPSRISFAVSSQTDSRVILDMGGAEKLLGKGDMLFAPVGTSKPIRVQGAFVSNREIEAVVEYVGSQLEAQYIESLCRLEESAQGTGEDERDELFEQAVRVVVEAGQASVSMLQRRLRVGYTRAARLVDQLEAAGVVGPYEGSKPRQVFKNSEIVKSLVETAKRPQIM